MGITLEHNSDVQLRIVFSKDFSSDEANEITESFSRILPTIKSYVATASPELLTVVTAVIVFQIDRFAPAFDKTIDRGNSKHSTSLTMKEKVIILVFL